MLMVKFMQIKNVVLMEVLEQSASDTQLLKKDFYGSNGIRLSSCDNPEIFNEDTIYLRGKDSFLDNKLVSYDFNSEEAASNFITRVSKTIKDFNDKINENNTYKENNNFKVTIAQ